MGYGSYRLDPLALVVRVLRIATVSFVKACGRIHVPKACDRLFAIGGVIGISLYRITLSPLLGQQCLFSPTCSIRGIRSLKRLGWNAGMNEIIEQLNRCSGNYKVRISESGLFEMEASDGQLFPESDLSPTLICRYANARDKPREI